MSSWSEGPFERVERLAGLRPGRTLSEVGGQARRVCMLDSHPGWLYKEYRSAVQPAAAEQLDRLISFPGQLGGADRALVDRNASWPTSRVVVDAATVGVLLPEAPAIFRTVMSLPSGPRATMLEIDFLAQRDDVLVRRGIPPQKLANRVTICSSLVAMAALFERHGIVYLDWSYANAFWSTQDLSVYVIDVDGCSFGPRPLIGCPGWEDPLVPTGSLGGHPTDRYRVALMVARCITAVRTPEAPAALERLAAAQPELVPVNELVARAMQAQDPWWRPPVTELAAALRQAAAQLSGVERGYSPDGVGGWRQIGPRRPAGVTQPTPVPQLHPVPGPPAPWTKPIPPVPQPARGVSAGARAALITVAVLAFFLLFLYLASR